jgi:hypothetical protein
MLAFWEWRYFVCFILCGEMFNLFEDRMEVEGEVGGGRCFEMSIQLFLKLRRHFAVCSVFIPSPDLERPGSDPFPSYPTDCTCKREEYSFLLLEPLPILPFLIASSTLFLYT